MYFRYQRTVAIQNIHLKPISQLPIIQYVGLCVFSLPISFVMIEIIYTLSYYHLQIGSMNYYPLFRVRSWNNDIRCMSWKMVCAVCLSIFLWIWDMAGLLRGTFVTWWYYHRIWPSVTDMQHCYHARYPTDDWYLTYMFLLVYFSVEVCLGDVFPHSVSTRRDSCVRVYAPLTLAPPHEKANSNRGDPDLHLQQARGHLNWRMGLPALLGGILGCWIVWFPLILYSLWGVS